ncbi:MAG: reductive dehalogenase domain-containing protein [Thermodesulfobacteriota bacterium]|jgi:epoxyqueuosine reductase
MPETKNTEKLKALCRQWGGSLFGVADLRTFKREEILLPPPLIDQLSFGISIGYHLSDAILEGIENQPTPLYFHHYQRANILLDTIGLILNSMIQDLGYQAISIPASQLVDWKNQRGHLSHKHVARAAGLGWIGRNNLLVNEKFGSRIRLVTILTDLPLTADSPSSGNCGSCRVCLSVCPAGAIADRQEDFNHLRCYEQLRTFAKTLHFSHNICGICVKACQGPKSMQRA